MTDKNKNLLKDKELINYLGDVAVQLSAAMSINQLSKILTEIIHTLINVEYTGHYFWDSANNKLKIYDAIGFTEEDKKNAEETVMERHPGWVFRNKKMFHVKDTLKDKSGISVTGKRSFFVRSRLFIPVINKGNAVGCIGFASIVPNYFTSHHISVLSFICNIAGAVYSSIIDLNKEKHNQEILKKALVEAENAKKAKDSFLAKMSHEIRTPMNAIIGMSALLEDTKLDFTQKEFLNAISFSSDSLLKLINDILDFTKIKSDNIALENKNFNLKDSILKLYDVIDFKAKKKQIQLNIGFDNNINFIIGDEHRINQVILNLLDNAIKFTNKGTVDISIKLINETSTSQKIKFSITDNGIGIKKSKQTSIFEKFSQEDDSITRKYGGTGLGLAISKEIVNLYQSELKLTSELGKGSTFYFTITFKKIGDNDSLSQKNILNTFNLEGLNVLLVEDNEMNRLYTETALKKLKINVDSALNGLEAINKFKKNKYAIILMDLQMPVMNGIQATKEIRKLDQTIPIIAMTANTVESDINKIYKAGANYYLSKPFKPNDLFNEIEKLIVPQEEKQLELDVDLINNKIEINDELYSLDTLNEMLSNDSESIYKFIELFTNNYPKELNQLSIAYESNNFPLISKIAHKIKTPLHQLNMMKAYKMALYLEKESLKKLPNKLKLKDNLDKMSNYILKSCHQLKLEFQNA